MAKLILRIWLSCLVVYFTLPFSGLQNSPFNFSQASDSAVLEAPSNSPFHSYISVDSIVLIEFEEDSDSRSKSPSFALSNCEQGGHSAMLAGEVSLVSTAGQVCLTIDRVVWLDRFLI